MAYEYLVGMFILGFVWAGCMALRPDLRKPMLWSGGLYVAVLLSYFVVIKFLALFIDIGAAIIPGYWNPDTLFDFGRRTGGLAIEDVLFMIFAGGIVTSLYELVFGKRIVLRRTYRPHVAALIIGVVASLLLTLLVKPNPIYALILFGFVGAVVLWVERRDLMAHSLVGGVSFLIVYTLGYLLFLFIFPDYIVRTFDFSTISGILILGIPLEELLYAFSFGLLWAPLYEYAHGEKCVERK